MEATRLASRIYETAKQVKINDNLGLLDEIEGLSVVNDVLKIRGAVAEDIIDLTLLYEIWLWSYDRDDDTDVFEEGLDALAQSEEEGWETYWGDIAPYIEQ